MLSACRTARVLVAGTAVTLLVACQAPGAPQQSGTLTVFGAASAPPLAAPLRSATGAPDTLTGAPASLVIPMYALYVSTHTDCSEPQLVQSYGDSGVDKDFVTNPVLFTGAPAATTYPCVIFRMADVLHTTPASSFGNCVAGTEVIQDDYKDGETDYKDQDLNPIIGHGTNDAPVDDHIAIFFTTDTTAALARGLSAHQIVPLGSPLIVPGQSTFYMDAHDAMKSYGSTCTMDRPYITFQ